MKARQQLTNLTLAWMAYFVASSGVGVFYGGFGFWSLLWSAVVLSVSLGISYLIGAALVNKNGVVRAVVSVLSGLMVLLGLFAMGKVCLLLVATWSFGLLIPLASIAALVGMNVYSLKVLYSRSVRRYFR